jgi:hypothetical protein
MSNVLHTKQVIHYGMDAGSVPNGNFSWVSSESPEKDSDDLAALASKIIDDMGAGRNVTLGLECPLFWPCPDEIARLGTRRPGEGRRSWSAGAGATITPTGCQSLSWLLRSVAGRTPAAKGTTCWEDFQSGKAGIFLWEAFASDKPETVPHDIDARLVLLTFLRWRQNPGSVEQITADHPINLAAALFLWSGLGEDAKAIRSTCLGLKVTYPTPLPEWGKFRKQIQVDTAKLLNGAGREVAECEGREAGASLRKAVQGEA